MEEILTIISVIIAGTSLLITIIFNLVNQYRIIKDNEPQLSFNLKEIDGMLYLLVHNVKRELQILN